MAIVGFTVDIRVLGVKAAETLRHRLVDFEPAWNEIVSSFIAHNADKFKSAKGGELVGVFHDGGDVYWEPVSERYWSWKRDKAEDEGWPGAQDWRMVLTGETMESLTERSNSKWFELLEPHTLTMGSLAEGAYHQAEAGSPPVFLDETDRKSITRELFDWLQGNPPYNPLPIDEVLFPGAESKVDFDLGGSVQGLGDLGSFG